MRCNVLASYLCFTLAAVEEVCLALLVPMLDQLLEVMEALFSASTEVAEEDILVFYR